VALQISLSLVLLVLAGLFTQSLVNVSRIDFGMDPDPVTMFSVTPFLSGASGERLDAVYDRVEEELAAQPGVESVGAVAFPLFYGFGSFAGVTVVGLEEQPEDNSAQGNPMIGPGLFETLSIPLLAGRDFTETDSAGSPTVAIVNESFVRKFDLGDDAIGTVLRFTGNPYVPQNAVEIIGIVRDARYTTVKGDIQPQFFTPRPQFDTTFNARFFYVRSSVDADTMLRMIPGVIERIDPSIPVSNLNMLRNLVDNAATGDRLMSVLSTTFAGLATVLAAIGLYGLLAFNVTQRQRELGLRLALGATPGALQRLVLGEVGRIGLIGGVIGLAAALGLGRIAEAMLFGVSGYDPLALASAVTVMGIVVLAASYLPARRASNVAPMDALRYE
jgi:predicted permease